MNDYYDLIYLLGAITAFSLLSLHTNRMLQMNSRMQLNSEIEYNAVSIAQDHIDQIRWIRTESEFISHKNSFPKEVELDRMEINFSLMLNKCRARLTLNPGKKSWMLFTLTALHGKMKKEGDSDLVSQII